MSWKIKESVEILKRNEEYIAIFHTEKIKKRLNLSNQAQTIMHKLIEGTYKEEEVCSEKENIDNIIIQQFKQIGILNRKEHDFPHKKYLEQVRYLEDIGLSRPESYKAQEKLMNTDVTVLGAGGIGSWIINGLNQIGVENITVIDPDIVETQNLNRQLYSVEDVGEYKIDSIKQKYSDTNVKGRKNKVKSQEDLEEIIEHTDFIINCADEPSVYQTSKYVDMHAKKHNHSYCIAGGYSFHQGFIGPIIVPSKTAGLEKYIKHQVSNKNDTDSFIQLKSVEGCGTTGFTAGIIANIQLSQIFKHLTENPETRYNQYAEYDFTANEVKWINYAK